MGHVEEFKLNMLKLNLKTTRAPLRIGTGELTRVWRWLSLFKK